MACKFPCVNAYDGGVCKGIKARFKSLRIDISVCLAIEILSNLVPGKKRGDSIMGRFSALSVRRVVADGIVTHPPLLLWVALSDLCMATSP